jgi:ADP-dependent phosphofructokinase/glucokinase
MHTMALPGRALFAFNCQLDHLRQATDADLGKIEGFSPPLRSQMDECFSWGVQKEITIDTRACEFFLSSLKFDRTLIGGQAGNAAEQASSLGVECLVHSNFANESLATYFSHPLNVLLAGESGFVIASDFSARCASAHHFVFEHPETRTRFIASHDPVPLHPEDNFIRNIGVQLPSIGKAFISGMHLVPSVQRLQKFADEISRWKEINPKLQTFLELGQFQKPEVRDACRKIIFPLVDMVGLNEYELAAFGCELDELAQDANSLLFHTPEHSLVLPREKENESALAFAEKCASFLARNGRHATGQEIAGYEGGFIDSPARTVGLGDTFSCAYFMQL